MADSPLLHHEPAPPVTCGRCGRIFEAPFELEQADGTKVFVRGHVQGDPMTCIPIGPSALRGLERDARRRRATRRGRP
jgi:hypothetical protein